MTRKFDWVDVAMLVTVFVVLNLLMGYIQADINPCNWDIGARTFLVFTYTTLGWVPLIIRRSM